MMTNYFPFPIEERAIYLVGNLGIRQPVTKE